MENKWKNNFFETEIHFNQSYIIVDQNFVLTKIQKFLGAKSDEGRGCEKTSIRLLYKLSNISQSSSHNISNRLIRYISFICRRSGCERTSIALYNHQKYSNT